MQKKEVKSSLDKFHYLFGTPKGTRTPDSAVRGQRLNRLTMRAFSQRLIIIPYSLAFCKDFKAFNKKKSGKPLLKIFPTCAD